MDDQASAAAPRRRLSIIERAFELARTGACRTVEEIARRLKQENYESVDTHLGATSLRKELRQICAEARATRMDDSADRLAAE